MSSRSRWQAWTLLLAASSLRCVDVTDARTKREATVGHAAGASLTVDVEQGLAAVRRLENDGITLWAGAPAIRATVGNALGDRSIVLEVDNVLADAVLVARTAEGASVPSVEQATDVPTRKRWRLALAASSQTQLFVAPLDAEDPTAFRFALLSDVQEAIDRVQDIYRRMNDDPLIRFVISSGDLTRRGTRDELTRFERELMQLRVPFFSTNGNHELGTEDGAPFQEWFGRGNFRFVHRGVQFTFLDSGSATIDPAVYGWLDAWLAEGKSRVHVVTMHIPPIDPVGLRNGSFADRAEAAKLLTRLALGQVDLTLYGHVHSFYAFANAGIPAYISGGGGAIPERLDGIGRNYLTVDIDPSTGVGQTALVRIDPD